MAIQGRGEASGINLRKKAAARTRAARARVRSIASRKKASGRKVPLRKKRKTRRKLS